MFFRGIRLFDLFGFPLRVDGSWIILAVLVTWSLAETGFPATFPGFPVVTYWLMGVAGSLLLFFSITFHELAHALVARHYGLKIRSITLFIFGGVAEMDDAPPSPRAEFWVAIAGPIASVALALALAMLYLPLGGGMPAGAVLVYMSAINLMLAVFNMAPAFPLDGGRIFRAALWAWKGDLRWATRIAGTVGGVFGFGLIGLGVFALIQGAIIAGIWWVMIGWFMQGASRVSYEQLVVQKVLEGQPVSRFMQTDPITAPRMITIRQMLEEYVYRFHFQVYPVVEGGRLLGCVSIESIKEVPREAWDERLVAEVIEPWPEGEQVGPDDDAFEALKTMSRDGIDRMVVVEDGALLGVLCLRDLLRYLSLKMDLEGDN